MDRGWGLRSVHHTSLPLLPPQGEDSSHSAAAPAWGPTHERQSSMNCSNVGPFHGVQSFRNRLLPCGSPTGSQVLPANLLQHGLLSLHGSTGPARSLLQHGLPTGSQSLLGIQLLQSGVLSMGYRWIPAPPWTSMGWRGTACLTVVGSMGCRGISAPARGTLPPALFFTDFSVCRVVSLTYSHFSLPAAVLQDFFPLLYYVIPEALPPSLMGLTLASSGSVLETAGIGSIGHGESFWQLLTKNNPVPTPLPKPCHPNPIHTYPGFILKMLYNEEE